MKNGKRGLALLMALSLGLMPAYAMEEATDPTQTPDLPAVQEAPVTEGFEEPAETVSAPEEGAPITIAPETDAAVETTIVPETDTTVETTIVPETDATVETTIAPDATEEIAVENATESEENAPVEEDSAEMDAAVAPVDTLGAENGATQEATNDGLNGTTDPVDSSTTLADGEYAPEGFSFSGGTGKTKITCQKVTVSGGKAKALIRISSTKYGYVKANGTKYDPITNEDGSQFEIDVDLNVENKVIGMTAAMDAPHEIEYSILITLTEPEKKPEPSYEDGDYNIGVSSDFKMFAITSQSAKVQDGKLLVTIGTSKTTYNGIYLGSKDDAAYEPVIEGVENSHSGYDFTFELPMSKLGQTIPFVPRKTKDGTWYVKNQYSLTIPENLEKPSQEPEPTKMFNVTGVSTQEESSLLRVVLTSDSADFDKIFIGALSTYSKTPNYPRRTLSEGKYFYEFTLPASNAGKTVKFVAGAPDGTWLDSQLTFTVPEPSQLPERPAAPEYGDGSYTAAVPVYVESNNGLGNSAMDALYTEITIEGDSLNVIIYNRSTSYNQLYVGKVGDESKTAIARQDSKKYADAYYSYTFTLPKSALGTMVPVVPGKDGKWASSQNYLAIPDYLTVVSQKPVEPDDPKPTAAPVEDGDYTMEVESSAAMFKVVNCVLTAKDGKYTAAITLSGTGYDKLFMGTGEEAGKADESAYIGYATDEEGRYVFTVPVSALDQEIPVAAHSVKKDSWYDRTLTFKSSTLSKVEKKLDDGQYEAQVESSAAMFKVVNCVLTAKNGEYTADITLSGTGYDKLFMGTGEEAGKADESTFIGYKTDADGRYVFTVPVSALDQGIPVAAHSVKKDSWYDRTLTFKSEGLKKVDGQTPEGTPEPTATPTPEPTQKPEEDLNGSTGRVDSSTTLADGTYTPDKFSFSGGTGKVGISCSKVTVSGGKAVATLVFSSPSYSYVKANGQKIYGSHSGSTSTFEVPVSLNENNRIIGMTTAMTKDHEVEYTICVYLSEDGGETEDNEANVTGLTFLSKDENAAAQGFEVYRYEDDIIVINVKNVSRYMVVPEGVELPMGASDGMILVQRPVKSVYAASMDALRLLVGAEEMLNPVTMVGFPVEEMDVQDVADRMADGTIAFAGSYDAPDYAALLKETCGLAIMPVEYADSAVMGQDQTIESELEPETAQALNEVVERLEMLSIPLFVDVSSLEETQEGRLEWIKIYGILLDCEEVAQDTYDAVIAALAAQAAQ